MSGRFKDKQHLVDNFKANYGVDFSYESFEISWRSEMVIADSFSLGETESQTLSRVYERKFGILYKEAFTNFIDKKVESFDNAKFLNDFQEMMNGYREIYEKESGETMPKWSTRRDLAHKAQEVASNFPTWKSQFAIDRYQAGALPIRNMRAHMEDLKTNGPRDAEHLSTLLAYAQALKMVNEDRPLWWRILHPFRNNAEQRDAKLMENYVKDTLSEEDYEKACDIALDNTIDPIGRDINNIVSDEDMRYQNERIAQQQRTKLNITSLDKEDATKKSDKVETKEVPTKSAVDIH